MNIIIKAFSNLKEAIISAKTNNNGLKYDSSTKMWYTTTTDKTNTKNNINDKFVTDKNE